MIVHSVRASNLFGRTTPSHTSLFARKPHLAVFARAWSDGGGSSVISMKAVSYEYEYEKPILDEASFSITQGSKVTLMGQNGSGKSTIFKLINRVMSPDSGTINIIPGTVVATAQQTMAQEFKKRTVEEYFKNYYSDSSDHSFHSSMNKALKIVALEAPKDRVIGSFSGGQQGRLLLAAALIQQPDVLLLDEPTNNLDQAGIERLTEFIITSPKTILVISHDSDFLNSFTDSVVYLDSYSQKIEQYEGNYFAVQYEIEQRIKRENAKNARMVAKAKEKRDRANKFSDKNRDAAARMRKVAEKAAADIIDVRKEDVAIKRFTIPTKRAQGDVVMLESVNIRSVADGFQEVRAQLPETVRVGSRDRIRLAGPNGIGKTTLLESLAGGKDKGARIADGVSVGYYRQDFSSLDFDHTVHECLSEYCLNNQKVRAVGASFQLGADLMSSRVGTLSEGQKGLLAFARLVLQQPSLLILDEPTNHINFRHLPVIAKALEQFEGAIILVSHDSNFVDTIRVDHTVDLGGLLTKNS